MYKPVLTRAVAVNESTLVCDAPEGARICSIESEVHVEASQALPPMRDPQDHATEPNPLDTTVMLIDPVDGLLLTRTLPDANIRSTDKILDTLPTLPPDVTATALLPPCPADDLHSNVLSDVHAVPSHDVPPARDPTLSDPVSKSTPRTLTYTCPLPATFIDASVDALPASYERMPEQEPTTAPAVIRRL